MATDHPQRRHRDTRRTSHTARPLGRGLQCAAGLTALALTAGLVAGHLQRNAPDAAAAPAATVAAAGHHGTPPAPASSQDSAAAPEPALAPGTKLGADGHVVHDHGDLQVTVKLGANDATTVDGPVRPGAWIALVNHTTADQVLTTADGTLSIDVPLRRLVSVQAPTAPGTYQLASSTDTTVTADLVVTADTGPGTALQN